MITAGKLLYTAKTRTILGRDSGVARSSDGHLDLRLAIPGSARIGTNPEQLFAVAWSACLQSAILQVARKQRVALPATSAIDAEVDLKLDNDSYVISVRFNISLPDVEPSVARHLVDEAHQICAYSNATRGNIGVTISLI